MSNLNPAQSSPADRNLLFGILALMNTFISQDTLIAATRVWLRDKSRPLGHILLEEGKLTPSQHEHLRDLERDVLGVHENDAHQCLNALAKEDFALLRDELVGLSDSDIDASLAGFDSPSSKDPYATHSALSAADPAHTAGLRYRKLRPHKKGGLGEVSVAQDEEVHREVALKEIREEYAHHVESRSRFLLEAEITGGLEHPGVVPVYGLGHYPDGRPFYAMRFIKGDTLQKEIQDFHDADKTKRDPGERSLAFRQFLKRFVDACNAIAYAHDRKVLHRDLKPLNIMLGKFGETLVVDWGLAKIMERGQARDKSEEGTLRPSSASDTPPTQEGHVLGTPAYMSPEQARGELDRMGPPSDIYSLGATLYTLLTGAVPFEASEATEPSDKVKEILERVKRGEFLPPRQRNKRVPKALEAICLKAMALNPDARHQTAPELAADVEHWLADEPVSAWKEPFTIRGRRWVRRHRVPVAVALASLLVAVFSFGIATVLLASAYKREQDATRKAQASFDQTFHVVRQIADLVTEEGSEGQKLLGWGKGEAGPLQKKLQEKVLGFYREFAEERIGDPAYKAELAEAFRRRATLESMTGIPTQAIDSYSRALELLKELAAVNPTATEYQVQIARCHEGLAQLYSQTGKADIAEKELKAAIKIWNELVRAHPKDNEHKFQEALDHLVLGMRLQNISEREQEADAEIMMGVRMREQVVAIEPKNVRYVSGLAMSRSMLASWYNLTRRATQAEEMANKSIETMKQLSQEEPLNQAMLALAYIDLARSVTETSRATDAEKHYGNALAIFTRLDGDYPGNLLLMRGLGQVHCRLGHHLNLNGRGAEAEDHFRKAIRILVEVTNRVPVHDGMLSVEYHPVPARASERT